MSIAPQLNLPFPTNMTTQKSPTEFMHALRHSQYPHLTSLTYLDYTASAPYPQTLPQAHLEHLQHSFQSNPHSETPPSTLSTQLIRATTQQILTFFNASNDYTVVFTANATAAAKLVGEAFPFRRASKFILTKDNHNSILGLRCFAEKNNASVSYIPLDQHFRLVDVKIPTPKQPSLLAYPAQSNFSGVRHGNELLHRAQKLGYYVLLDASAFVPTSRLDLSKSPADFVTVSFYKMFGYPTGIGALIAKKSALAALKRPSFSGGTVDWVSVNPGKHVLLKGEDAFHDGTPDFLGIPAVGAGLMYLNSIGLDVINKWVANLTNMLIDGMTRMTDDNGERLIRIYGPESNVNRGGTIAFDVVMQGKRVRADLIADALGRQGVCVRAGCFCNPGCGEHALVDKSKLCKCAVDGISKEDLSRCLGKGLSFVRVSVGLGALEEDIETFLKILREFCDHVVKGVVKEPYWDVEQRKEVRKRTWLFRA